MLQEFNQKQKAKLVKSAADLAWWRTWMISKWADLRC